MPKKTLIEINLFNKFLKALFTAKQKGDENELDKAFAKTNNPELQKAYNAWKTDSNNMLISTRELLKRAGKDTSKIDAIIKKYT